MHGERSAERNEHVLGWQREATLMKATSRVSNDAVQKGVHVLDIVYNFPTSVQTINVTYLFEFEGTLP
jgi:hypothetical protein